MKPEFNKIATEAALMAIDEMIQERDKETKHGDGQKEHSTDDDVIEKGQEYVDQAIMFATCHWLKAQILTEAIDKLKKDIINQSFDF